MSDSQLMAYFSTYVCQGRPRERFLILGFFPSGSSHHGNSRDVLYGNRPPRESFPPQLRSHHGNSRDCLYRNRPSREPSCGNRTPRGLATTGIHVFFQSDYYFLPRKRPPWDLTGRERAVIFVGVFGIIKNQYVRERYLI